MEYSFARLKFDFDVPVDSMQKQTDTLQSNSTFCTFSDKCLGPAKLPGVWTSYCISQVICDRGEKIYSSFLTS